MERCSLRGGAGIHYHGKILAKSFLPGMGLLCFIAMGNYL